MTIRQGVLLAALLSHGLAQAAPSGSIPPLDRAIQLAMAESRKLAAMREESTLAAKETDWSVDVRFGAARAQTLKRAAGVDASITVAIPIWDQTAEREAAKSRARVAKARQALRAEVVEAAQQLVSLAVERAQAREMAALARDRLKYKEKRVAEGLAEAPSMWPRAKAAKRAEHKARAKAAQYRAKLETVARTFGGERWQTMRDWLAEHAKRNTP